MNEHFNLIARYNQWANQTLYAAVATLPPDEIARDRNGFFRSILGTLNHLLVADRVWIARLSGENYGWFTALNQILYPEFSELRQAREDDDRTLIKLTANLSLTGNLTYTNCCGEQRCVPISIVLSHIFNHQTHHRGQVHGMLSQAGKQPPPLDLLYCPYQNL
jgi:uncharacterized damage-inducible protein DinB